MCQDRSHTNYNMDEDEKTPLMAFEVYRSVGDYFLKKDLLEKSVACYDKALDLVKNDQYCLTKRSKAYVKLNQLDLALKDANNSIQQNQKNFQAILQKARVHYLSGDFEKALSYYHRGHNLRPRIYDFLMGIHNSERAIGKSLDSTTTFHFRSDEEYELFCKFAEEGVLYNPKQEYEIQNTRKKTRMPQKSVLRIVPKFSHMNLERLMPGSKVDYDYLEQFFVENVEHIDIVDLNQVRFQKSKLNHFEEYIPSIVSVCKVPIAYYASSARSIHNEMTDCLDMMTKRCEFWHMHDPNTVREKENLRAMRRKWSLLGDDNWQSFGNICDNIEMIYEKQSRGNHVGAIAHLKRILSCIENADLYQTQELSGKRTILATLYCLLGISYTELKKYEKAVECHVKDLEIAVDKRNHMIASRAADNLARVYALMKDYRKSISILTTRLTRPRNILESVWLRYSLGKCEYHLKNFVGSLDHAEQCFSLVQYSKEPELDVWYIRSCILIGQSEYKLENIYETQDRYKMAQDRAREKGFNDWVRDIDKVMHDLKKLIVKREIEDMDNRRNTLSSFEDSDLIDDEYEVMKMRNLYSALVAKRNKSQGRTMCAQPNDTSSD